MIVVIVIQNKPIQFCWHIEEDTAQLAEMEYANYSLFEDI